MSPPNRHRTILVLALLAAGLVAGPTAAPAASIETRHGAVAAEHRLASEAGVEILRRGGNAVDAAVAAALVTGVVNPSSSGLGGGGFLVLWDAAHSHAAAIDFRESAPRGAFDDMYVRADGSVDSEASKTGPLAIGVPGEARGLALALKRYGRLGFADVAAPAIRIARDGFMVEAHLAATITTQQTRIAADTGLAGVFLHADGTPLREGETLRRPQLAATLERLAKVGVDDFYNGEIAADIVRTVATWKSRPNAAAPSPAAAPPAVSANGEQAGAPAAAMAPVVHPTRVALPLGAKDLAAYRPIERAPLSFRYRGHKLITMGPPSSGGGVLAEVLGILGAYDVGKMDRSSVAWFHLLADSMKAAFADRAAYYGDPAFSKVPIARLISAAHAGEMRLKLNASHAVPSADFAPRSDAAHDAGTSHISVIDADGNAAALTTSVNTGFGSGISVPGRDIVLNNTMDDFSAQPGKANHFGLLGNQANAIAPGKRPVSSMTPAVVLDGGHVRMTAGASGGPMIITSTLQVLLDVLDFGMSADDAVSAPRIHHQWMPEVLTAEAAIPDATKAALTSLGHHVGPLLPVASVQAITVSGSGSSRELHAASDPRKGGIPAGY